MDADEDEFEDEDDEEEEEEEEEEDEEEEDEEDEEEEEVEQPTKKARKGTEQDTEFGVARGVDFKNVANVINFDFPLDVPHIYPRPISSPDLTIARLKATFTEWAGRHALVMSARP